MAGRLLDIIGGGGIAEAKKNMQILITKTDELIEELQSQRTIMRELIKALREEIKVLSKIAENI